MSFRSELAAEPWRFDLLRNGRERETYALILNTNLLTKLEVSHIYLAHTEPVH